GSEPAPVEEIVVIYKVPDRPRPFRVFSYLSDSEFWHNTAMIVLPEYDLYHCLADGGCGAADYGVAVLGAIPIPGAKAASVGVRGVARGGRNLPIKEGDRLAEINRTLDLIESGGPFRHRRDGAIFRNKESKLPEGNYREYTVDTPGASNRGARRVVHDANSGRTYY